MEFELDGCILKIRCDGFYDSDFTKKFIKNFIPWLQKYFNDEDTNAHCIPELIDKWDSVYGEFTLWFNLMCLSIC